MDDNILVSQIKQGNQLAFTTLYKTYSAQAFVLSFKYLCNKSLAEDAVQNLFMKLWLKREDIDEALPINRFLFTILKNDLLNILRDTKSNIFVLEDCMEMLNSIDGEEAEENDTYNEQSEVLHKAMEKLSPQRKIIFTLKATGKYSNQEIAEKLNLSINTIKFQYSQSLKQIKALVRELSIMMLMML